MDPLGAGVPALQPEIDSLQEAGQTRGSRRHRRSPAPSPWWSWASPLLSLSLSFSPGKCAGGRSQRSLPHAEVRG